jgi:hypothetical protein
MRVVSTGAVGLRSPPVREVVAVVALVLDEVLSPLLGAEVVSGAVECEGGDAASFPPPPESTIAATTPATAAAATTAASTAFLTGPEATLARPWLHPWKSS